MEEIRCLLWLLMVFGTASPKIWTVLHHWKTPQKACEALRDSSGASQQGLPSHVVRRMHQIHAAQVDEVLARCEKQKISILWYGEPEYPEELFAIVNPPVLLFYRGDLSVLRGTLSLTVVGTRHPSEYSRSVAWKLCRDLVQLGFVMVTGFAVGIDIIANRCALEAGKPSVALMGCGLDIAYPQQHFELKEQITANGLILSEFLPGTPPSPANLPIRNRVLSGLTMGTLVIQAPQRSGTLITAENAMEQGRDVFCVPPANIFDKQYQGVIKYLRDGAIPVFDCRDIVYEYYTNHAHQIDGSVLYDEDRSKSDSMVMTMGEEAQEKEKKAKKPPESPEMPQVPAAPPAEPEPEQLPEPAESEAPAELEELDESSRRIYQLLRENSPMHIDAIAAAVDMEMEQLTETLTILELNGVITRLPGKQFRIM